ncbi:hypothetical protein [Enterococcus cecorum]|uniref:hypothetical protein n=1 Tax=Enterococcus cecorum TaxID=44008 RepID=UPI001FADAD44|nr:hypothetical protein [Enterococcus cecorum]MCJ0522253.1 hypothetical protein [Enterococcus cecorum]MCJ0560697.1 hypothetical protein [Enterococcus cecorum]MCJ0599402.1 hypothetical protein [Enterococcus cecorum]MCJ0603798.1 hypothetical protein [Enterococcus cecorum]
MKMIEVFDLMAKKEIKHETQLIIHYDSVCRSFRYHKLYQTFLNDNYERMEEEFVFGDDFLNFEVELIPPKEKKYLIKMHIKGLIRELTVVNYQRLIGEIVLASPGDTNFVQTSFTKSEMQSIEPIREFLADMKGKYTFIEVEDNEND